jgi:hypothetical protein
MIQLLQGMPQVPLSTCLGAWPVPGEPIKWKFNQRRWPSQPYASVKLQPRKATGFGNTVCFG